MTLKKQTFLYLGLQVVSQLQGNGSQNTFVIAQEPNPTATPMLISEPIQIPEEERPAPPGDN